jgi:hypothetical protein
LNAWTVIYITIYMTVSHLLFLYLPGYTSSSELGAG